QAASSTASPASASVVPQEHATPASSATPADDVDSEPMPVPFVELGIPSEDDSGERERKPAVEFQPEIAAALDSTTDPAESGFFAFRSSTFFTASAVESDAPASLEPAQPATEHASEPVSSSQPFTVPSAATEPAATESGEAQISQGDAPVAFDAAPAENNAPNWWNAEASEAPADEPSLALAPATAANNEYAALTVSAVDGLPSSEADQAADFHSVLAQLLPTTSAPSTDTHIPADLVAAESLACDVHDAEVCGEHAAASDEPSLALEPAARDEHKAASAHANGSSEHNLNPQPQWNSSLVSSICELGEQHRQLAAHESAHESGFNGSSAQATATAVASSEVTDAVERVLARFRDSLLSEVMRELSPK
ncbi:MAG TPA: hypothetical protein VE998_11480, partial [Terriglobales bacterium]|nr:hypothetical protein [Terriglobales bacterium]